MSDISDRRTDLPEPDYLQVPILERFDQAKPIGWVKVLRDALPPTPSWCFSLGYEVLQAKRTGITRLEVTDYRLHAVSITSDDEYERVIDREKGRLLTEPTEHVVQALRERAIGIARDIADAFATERNDGNSSAALFRHLADHLLAEPELVKAIAAWHAAALHQVDGERTQAAQPDIRKALEELVACKALADQFDAMKQDVHDFATAAVLDGIQQEYQRRKAPAWEAARAALSQPQAAQPEAERERCAKLCDEVSREYFSEGMTWECNGAASCASRIRATPPTEPAPRTKFEDERVQRVYEILSNTDDVPPPEQHWEGWVARRIVDALEPAPQAEPAVTEAMVTAYLQANDAYWKRIDGEPTKLGKWRNGTPSEATRVSLAAALAAAPQAEPTPQKRKTRPLPGGIRLTVTERCELDDWCHACIADALAATQPAPQAEPPLSDFDVEDAFFHRAGTIAPQAEPAAVGELPPLLNFDQLQSVMAAHFGGRELTDDEADSAESFARAVERAVRAALASAPHAPQARPAWEDASATERTHARRLLDRHCSLEVRATLSAHQEEWWRLNREREASKVDLLQVLAAGLSASRVEPNRRPAAGMVLSHSGHRRTGLGPVVIDATARWAGARQDTLGTWEFSEEHWAKFVEALSAEPPLELMPSPGVSAPESVLHPSCITRGCQEALVCPQGKCAKGRGQEAGR